MIVVYFDGLCEPRNPGGVATYGFVVYINRQKIHEGCAVVGEGKGMSNNVAEFSGLVAALEWLLENGYTSERIIVRGDSRLAINLMNGVWTARGGMYYPYYRRAVEVASKFSNISFEWVPRNQNEKADSLSRKAYEEYCRGHNKPVRYMKDEAGRRYSASKNYYSNNKSEKETCLTCRWVQFSGPHIGCFYNGQYQKWLPRRFARYNKCDNYEPQS